MDMKIYSKTRYQNIYKHKNGNYVVIINKPVKSSISRIDGEKIWKIEQALKIRDNPKTGFQKRAEIKCKDTFDELWDQYVEDCIYNKKLVFNTINKKQKIYQKYLYKKIDKRMGKIDKNYLAKFIDKIRTSDKQKNEILKQLKAFFNWCVAEDYLLVSPASPVKNYKVTRQEMKYWKPEELQQFFNYMNSVEETEKSLRIKTLVILGFSLGNRIGESRALTFGAIKKDRIVINHSINYDKKSKDFLASTKNYQSQRVVDVSPEVIKAVNYYKAFLINLGYNINDDTLIFLNHKTQKPLDDVLLRKQFYEYCELAGVAKIRLYDLRHTYATTMMREGLDPYMFSQRMGHKSIKTTLDVYGHISEDTRKEIAKTTDKYIF